MKIERKYWNAAIMERETTTMTADSVPDAVKDHFAKSGNDIVEVMICHSNGETFSYQTVQE